MLWLMTLLTLACASAAGGLFLYARQREQREELLLRLRAGDAAAASLAGDATVANPVLRWVYRWLSRAGLELHPRKLSRLLLVIAVLSLAALLLLGLLRGVLLLAALALIAMTWLNLRVAHRRARIVEQLPAYLEAVMRILAAGNTLEESMDSAARESVEPLRSLFVSVGRQVRLGAAVDVVLSEAAEIQGVADLRVMALAANINRKYGGSLRNVFRSLIQSIRMREAAARELRALTAETRFSAAVLAAVPLLVSAFIYFRNRAFYEDMLSTTGGKLTLVLAVILQIAGMFIIWRMMRSTQAGRA